MSDLISQIQELITDMANLMCNSIGYLQECAPPSDFSDQSESEVCEEIESDFAEQSEEPTARTSPQQSETYCESYAKQIIHTAKLISTLIETLPVDNSSPVEQEKKLLELDDERAKAAKELEKLVAEAETLSDEMAAITVQGAELQINSRPRV